MEGIPPMDAFYRFPANHHHRSNVGWLLDSASPVAPSSSGEADPVSYFAPEGLLLRRRRHSPVVCAVAGWPADRLYRQGPQRCVPPLSARFLRAGASSVADGEGAYSVVWTPDGRMLL